MLKDLSEIVRQAGDILLNAQDIRAHTRMKTSASDLVTDFDLEVETFLRRALLELLPEAGFYGEEEADRADPHRGSVFIVDPIDGTANFVRNLGPSNISVALAKDGAVEYGVVYDPVKGELFTAQRGGGAFLNGEPIHVSDLLLNQGIFLLGTSIYHRDLIEPTMTMAERLLQRSCDLRRLGSAALDLCYVACGRAELFFEYSLCPWDHAAGGLILTEAGGSVCTFAGGTPLLSSRCSIWASNRVNAGIREDLVCLDDLAKTPEIASVY